VLRYDLRGCETAGVLLEAIDAEELVTDDFVVGPRRDTRQASSRSESSG
jgi:hypothetical protein